MDVCTHGSTKQHCCECENENEISTLRAKLSEAIEQRDLAVQDYNGLCDVVVERDAKITTLRAQLKDAQMTIDHLNELLDAETLMVKQYKEEQLDDNLNFKRLSREIDERDAEIDFLKNEYRLSTELIERKNDEIKFCNELLAQGSGKIREQKEEITRLKALLGKGVGRLHSGGSLPSDNPPQWEDK